jgi:hypothetical protein
MPVDLKARLHVLLGLRVKLHLPQHVSDTSLTPQYQTETLRTTVSQTGASLTPSVIYG